MLRGVSVRMCVWFVVLLSVLLVVGLSPLVSPLVSSGGVISSGGSSFSVRGPGVVEVLVRVRGCSSGVATVSVGNISRSVLPSSGSRWLWSGVRVDSGSHRVVLRDVGCGSVVVGGVRVSSVGSVSPFSLYAPGFDDGYLRSVRDAGLSKQLGKPTGVWLGSWSGDVRKTVSQVVARESARGRVPVFVVYGVPGLDCGRDGRGFSPVAYKRWVRSIAGGVGGKPVVFILEPDALSFLKQCGNVFEKQTVGLLGDAVRVLSGSGAWVYLDVGHSNWHSVDEMASRVRAVGTRGLRGVSVNVSNYQHVGVSEVFGRGVARVSGVPGVVVDVGRSGAGPGSGGDYWCNGRGARLGVSPRSVGRDSIDALLWVKPPGESDGYCNGGPAAGVFWGEYARKLVFGW